MHLHHLTALLSPFLLSTHAATSPLTPREQIHQTLHTYAIAIDSKQAVLFPQVFTRDAVANYTGPLSNLTGITSIQEALLLSVSTLATQHQLGTMLIDVNASGDGGMANSTSYFIATLVSISPETAGDYTVLHGLYRDELVEVAEVGWRVKKRQLEFMTPNLGNLTLS